MLQKLLCFVARSLENSCYWKYDIWQIYDKYDFSHEFMYTVPYAANGKYMHRTICSMYVAQSGKDYITISVCLRASFVAPCC